MKDSISKSVRIIPAYAGSTSMSTMTGVRITDHPRIRGEHDDKRRAGQPRSGIIPAYAGSTGQHTPSHRPASGSSPHTRGAPRLRIPQCPGCRIIPAYAGSTTRTGKSANGIPDHPRIRGEHSDGVLTRMSIGGSSPHTRGALLVPWWRRRRRRIIPAYAGSTDRDAFGVFHYWDHPRIRGEHLDPVDEFLAGVGSSPHTRGAPSAPSTRTGFCRIIPAYAGSTVGGEHNLLAHGDHPRIRGEHVPKAIFSPKDRGSSPHTRGAQCPSLYT